jgi:uncharacterized repeat protein (TIGR01451 family)
MRLKWVRASFALVIIGFAVAAQAGINAWTTKGPPGGTYRAFEASPSDPNVFYAAYSHGFFYSTDGGQTWSSHDFVNEVVNVAVDPQNSKRVYACVISEGLYRSTDGGVNFTKIASGTTGDIWAAAVGSNNVVYYATPLAFYRSTDGGDTFGPPVTIQQTFEHIYINAQDANKLYVIRGPYLMRSSDGGANWTESSIGSTTNWLYSLVELPNGALVVATSGGIYTRADENATWMQRTGGVTWSVAADPASSTTLIASLNGVTSLFRSTDGGLIWNPIGSPTTGRARRALVSGAGSNVFITANENGVQRSTDSGTHWQDAMSGPIASGGLSIATTLAANAPIYAYAYNAGGALYASTNDSTWERRAPALIPLEIGQAEISVRPGAPQTVYLAAFMRGIYRSTDGGMTFSPPGTGLANLDVTNMTFDAVNPDIMYAAVADISSHPASIYRSENGGQSWNPRSTNLTDVWAKQIVVDPADGNRMFLGSWNQSLPGNVGGLYASTDAGIHWTRIAFAGEDVVGVEIDPSDSNRMYVATTSGLQVSTNGGTSFLPSSQFSIITGGRAGGLAIDPVIPSTIYATSWYDRPCCSPQPSSYVLRSVDRGQTWEVLRDQTGPSWSSIKLLLDPNTPSRVVVDTGIRGIASYEIMNDLGVAISNHSGVRNVGEPSSFHLHAQHNGQLAATGVTIKTTIPSGLSDVSAKTDQGSCSVAIGLITCRVDVMKPGATSDVDVAYTPTSMMKMDVSSTISAHEGDNVSSNDIAQASTFVGHFADLAVSLVDTADPVMTGQSFDYRVTVTNAGNDAATSVTLTLTTAATVTSVVASQGTCTNASGKIQCTLDTIAAGGQATITITASTAASGTIAASAVVAAAGEEPSIADNSATQSTTVNAPPASPASPASGSNSGSGKSGGGGGGEIELFTVAFLSILGQIRYKRRRARPGTH